MKQKFLLMAALFLFTSFSAGTALASWSFYLTTDYSAGDSQATFYLNFSTDESVTFSPDSIYSGLIPLTYVFAFEYDSSELSYVSFIETPFDGLEGSGGIAEKEEKDSTGLDATISGVRALVLDKDFTVAAGDYSLASITFDVLEEAVDDGEVDFDFSSSWYISFIIDGTEYSYDDYGTALTPSTLDIGGGGSEVPVPAALWLFGSGLVGLIGLRRRRKD